MRYVRRRPDIMLILVVIGLIGMFGINFQMTTAIIARLVFDKGAAEYGLLGSIMAIGSLAGALLAARRDKPSIRLVVGSAFVVRRVLLGSPPSCRPTGPLPSR